MSAVPALCVMCVNARRGPPGGFLIHPLRSKVDAGEGMKESEDIQEPQNHCHHHNTVQDRFDGGLHGNEAIH